MNTSAIPDAKRLIIGCGTGRCGTVSLVEFLNSQAGVRMLHEGVMDDTGVHHLLPWYDGDKQLFAWLRSIEQATGDAKWFGDVGPYFMPYLPEIFKCYPSSRAICIERPKKDVVKSFMKKTEGRNHWFRHEGAGWAADPEWDDSFPCYAEPDKVKALGLYWDQYHCMALEYRARFPGQFKLVPTEALNTVDGQREILGFIEHDEPQALGVMFRANAAYKNRVKRSLARLSSLIGS